MDKKITEGEKLALFFLLYKEEYDSKIETIYQNLKDNLPPLNSIMSVSLAKKMEVINDLNFSELSAKYSDLFDLYNMEENEFILDETSNTLKETLQSNPLPPPKKGYYLAMYEKYKEEFMQWGDSELIAFLNLVILDLSF